MRDASDLFSAGAATINYSAESTNSPFRLGLLIFIRTAQHTFLFYIKLTSMFFLFVVVWIIEPPPWP